MSRATGKNFLALREQHYPLNYWVNYWVFFITSHNFGARELLQMELELRVNFAG